MTCSTDTALSTWPERWQGGVQLARRARMPSAVGGSWQVAAVSEPLG